jgi:HEAT repeat protein
MPSCWKTTCFFVVIVGVTACSQPPAEPAASRTDPIAHTAHAPTAHSAPPKPEACDALRLDRLLTAPHDPPTPEQLRATCADPIPELVLRATNTQARGLMRMRAMESLGKLGGAQATKALADLATASADLPSMRRTAVEALTRATTVGDEERDRVGVKALADADPHVRVAAARLLAGSKRPDVREELDRAGTRETETFVREAIDRAKQ